YQVLARDAEANRELYKNLLSRAKETNITQSVKSTNVRVVADADVPSTPSLKESRRRLLMAVVIGLCLGCGLAFGLEYSDNSIKTREDGESLLRRRARAVIPSSQHEQARLRKLPKPAAPQSGPRIVAELAARGATLPAAAHDGSVPGDPSELVVAKNPDS